jgi:hypothetical protein
MQREDLQEKGRQWLLHCSFLLNAVLFVDDKISICWMDGRVELGEGLGSPAAAAAAAAMI